MMRHFAITILQPWASLVIMGHKLFETRSWAVPAKQYNAIQESGGRLLIHSAQRLDKAGFYTCQKNPNFRQYIPDIMQLPFGHVVGSVKLGKIYTADEAKGVMAEQFDADVAIEQMAFGDFAPSMYSWRLHDPIAFEKPFHAVGNQKIWELGEQYYKTFYKG